jgi:hypothetical protein
MNEQEGGLALPFLFRDSAQLIQPRIVTAAQNAKGKVARAQIAVTQATLSKAGASSRIFLTNAISHTPKPRFSGHAFPSARSLQSGARFDNARQGVWFQF